LALLDDAAAGHPDHRPRLHGVCRRSVLHSVDDHGYVSRAVVTRSTQCAAVRAFAAGARGARFGGRREFTRGRANMNTPLDRRRFLLAAAGALGAAALEACDSQGPRSAAK